MPSVDLFGTKVTFAEKLTLPEPDSDNDPLFPAWSTKAEFMQRLQARQEALSRELKENPRLWDCPEHRLTRIIAEAMKRCCLWLHYGER